jgi:hypothetical protein
MAPMVIMAILANISMTPFSLGRWGTSIEVKSGKAVALNTWTPNMVEKSESEMAIFPVTQGRTDFPMYMDDFQSMGRQANHLEEKASVDGWLATTSTAK